MNVERAQSLVEAVLVLPLCLACAVAIVDCGVVVRDRIATSHAATRAAQAAISGSDVEAAARAAVPTSLAERLRVDREDGAVEVTATSRTTLLRTPAPVTHRSRAVVEVAR